MKKISNWWNNKRKNSKFLSQKSFNRAGIVKLLPIIFLASADAFSMAAPYYMWNVFPNLPEMLNISQGQLLNLTAAVGFTTLITQLPGGWLADKISSKKMLITSLFMTGGLMVIWSLMPFWGGYDLNGDGINDDFLYMFAFYIIYALWGVSTTLLFWTPLWKLLSQQAEEDEQGNVYGLQGMINGFFGFFFIYLLGFAAIQITASIAGVQIGFSLYSLFLSLMLFGSAIGIWAWIQEKPSKEKFSLSATTMKKVIKNYKIWLMAFFVMGIYVMQQGLTKMMPFMTANLFMVIWIVSLAGAIRTYVARMVISKPAGKFGDNHRSYIEILVWTLGVSLILMAYVIILPGFNNDFASQPEAYQRYVKVMTLLILIALGFLAWIMVTLRYTQIAEIDTPKNSYANVVAFISFIAFSTDAWLNPILGNIANNHLMDDGSGYATQTGNQIILGILLIIGIFGFFCGLTLWLINKKEYKKMGLTSYRKELNNYGSDLEDIDPINDKMNNQQHFLAHRGLSAFYPENTKTAFYQAYLHGYIGIETDVHLSKDNKLVICHDETIDRTANAAGEIRNLTLKELQHYNFGQKFVAPQFEDPNIKIPKQKYHKQKILTLEELLRTFGNKFTYINIEVKTDVFLYPGIEEEIVKTLKKYQEMDSNIILSSFNLQTLLKLRELDPSLTLAYLIWEEKNYKGLNIDYQLVHDNCQYIAIWEKLYLQPEEKEYLDRFNLPYIVWYWNEDRRYLFVEKEKEILLMQDPNVEFQLADLSFLLPTNIK